MIVRENQCVNKKYKISKNKFGELFPENSIEGNKSYDLGLNITIIFKKNNEYEIFKTTGPYVKYGSSQLAKLCLVVEPGDANELNIYMSARYIGLKFVSWTLFTITIGFLINALWRIFTLENSERFNLLIPALFTFFIWFFANKVYSYYRRKLIRSFEKYLGKN